MRHNLNNDSSLFVEVPNVEVNKKSQKIWTIAVIVAVVAVVAWFILWRLQNIKIIEESYIDSKNTTMNELKNDTTTPWTALIVEDKKPTLSGLPGKRYISLARKDREVVQYSIPYDDIVSMDKFREIKQGDQVIIKKSQEEPLYLKDAISFTNPLPDHRHFVDVKVIDAK